MTIPAFIFILVSAIIAILVIRQILLWIWPAETEYTIRKINDDTWKIYKRKNWYGITRKWREHYGWQTFANDDGGWPIEVSFDSFEKAAMWLSNRGMKTYDNGLMTTDHSLTK